METLTLLIFLLSIGLFVLSAYKPKQEVTFFSLICGIFSLTLTLTDATIGEGISVLVIISVFIILLSVVKLLFPSEG